MKLFLTSLCTLLLVSNISYAQQKNKAIKVESGVSLELAAARRAMISNIQYDLKFDLPADKDQDIKAKARIGFNLTTIPAILQLDFKPDPNHIHTITVNGKTINLDWQSEHILIDQQYLLKGANEIQLTFNTGSESLNRNGDYLYALFVPDHARTAFPCFDQPDLKARFLLNLTVPMGWKVLANASLKDSIATAEKVSYQFNLSDVLPTYLFSFAAGKFTALKQVLHSRNMEFLHRETDSNKVKLSVDSVFKAHADALDFLEQWTGIKYPFQKIGFISIPDFQFGGMEHPGEVQYKASALFLDQGATKDQFISRSNLISHETAHMWFGDLVTMQWFNDVWMKEVFANFMADKVTERLMGKTTFDLKFLQDHYPAAYGIDRTLGANPIRQQLNNLQDAGSMYGNIIYHKAPIMMRQLELLMGKVPFQNGIREYLNKYAYKNATWNDLIAILSKYSKTDLYNWNKVWVNQPGRPIFDYKVKFEGNKFSNLTITQKAEMGANRVWPQVFTIKLIYPGYSKVLPVNIKGNQVEIIAAKELQKPDYILFNADGAGYGLFPVNCVLVDSVLRAESSLERASVYINAYENMLAGRSIHPAELLRLFTKGIGIEKNEMNLRLLTGYISSIYWTFITSEERLAFSQNLEKAIWTAMEQQTQANHKKVLFSAFQNVCINAEAKKQLYNIWLNQKAPEGVKLLEDDYTALALTLALKTDTINTILKQQLDRIPNIDRKNRLSFLLPALSLNVAERDQFFNSLKDRKNRQKEAWVGTALAYLNHPLRQNTSVKYLPESLALLEEIKKTGDIFFPQSWLGAIFNTYNSKEAYAVVQDFLSKHPNYNPMLKAKILQATDNLRRAQEIVK